MSDDIEQVLRQQGGCSYPPARPPNRPLRRWPVPRMRGSAGCGHCGLQRRRGAAFRDRSDQDCSPEWGELEHRVSSTEAHSGAPNSVSFTVRKTPDGRSSPLYTIEIAGSAAPAFVTYSKDQKRGPSSPRSRLELAIDDIVMDRLVKMAIDDAFAA